MKRFSLLFCLCFPLFCIAQTQPSLDRGFDYDAAGNRVLRKVIILIEEERPPEMTPPPPQDPEDRYSEGSSQLSSLESLQSHTSEPHYYLEKIDRVEIKVYPNPAAEVVTLQISQWQDLQYGKFYLYSLGGQLLQEQQVHSATTEISLVNLAKGIYILKLLINDEEEDWKIVKQ